MAQKFKKVSRQVLPFEHCGAEYSETKQGYWISQKFFVDRMKPADIPSRSEESDLTPDEVTSFRSMLGALLWLTSTRLDLIAEVSFLQSKVTSAKVRDLKQANVVLKKAQEYRTWVSTTRSSRRIINDWFAFMMPVRHPRDATTLKKVYWFV